MKPLAKHFVNSAKVKYFTKSIVENYSVMPSSKEVKEILVSVLPNVSDIDESTLDYFESIISDATSSSDSSLTISTNIKESLCPFLESYGIITDLDAAEVFDIRHKIYNHSIINELRTIKELCDAICKRLQLADNSSGSSKPHNSSYSDTPQLLNKVVQLSEVAKNQVSEDEQATIDDLWGLLKFKKKTVFHMNYYYIVVNILVIVNILLLYEL